MYAATASSAAALPSSDTNRQAVCNLDERQCFAVDVALAAGYGGGDGWPVAPGAAFHQVRSRAQRIDGVTRLLALECPSRYRDLDDPGSQLYVDVVVWRRHKLTASVSPHFSRGQPGVHDDHVDGVARSLGGAPIGKLDSGGTITSPGTGTAGSITFKDGTTTLGTVTLTNRTAVLSTSSLALGSDSLTASYGSSTELEATLRRRPRRQSTRSRPRLCSACHRYPSTLKQSVTLTATVSAVAPGTGTPTGTIPSRTGQRRSGRLHLPTGRCIDYFQP